MSDQYFVRSLTIEDEPMLWTMLMYAAHESSLSVVKANPDLVRYVEGWGRDGDLGAIAFQDNIPVGAAWVRLWSAGNRGYGYVADDIPELAIAVIPKMRGKGTGTALLEHVFQLAKPEFSSISLSIRADNPALRLYKRLGFVSVLGSEMVNREGGRSFNMVKRL